MDSKDISGSSKPANTPTLTSVLTDSVASSYEMISSIYEYCSFSDTSPGTSDSSSQKENIQEKDMSSPLKIIFTPKLSLEYKKESCSSDTLAESNKPLSSEALSLEPTGARALEYKKESSILSALAGLSQPLSSKAIFSEQTEFSSKSTTDVLKERKPLQILRGNVGGLNITRPRPTVNIDEGEYCSYPSDDKDENKQVQLYKKTF